LYTCMRSKLSPLDGVTVKGRADADAITPPPVLDRRSYYEVLPINSFLQFYITAPKIHWMRQPWINHDLRMRLLSGSITEKEFDKLVCDGMYKQTTNIILCALHDVLKDVVEYAVPKFVMARVGEDAPVPNREEIMARLDTLRNEIKLLVCRAIDFANTLLKDVPGAPRVRSSGDDVLVRIYLDYTSSFASAV